MKFAAFAPRSFGEVGSVFKIFLIILASFLILSLSVKPVSAQTTTQISNNPILLNGFTQNVLMETLSAVSCQLTGINVTHRDLGCLIVDNITGKTRFSKSSTGALGTFTNLISMTFDIPVHSSQYVNYLAQNFGVAKKSYAAGSGGFGFDQLSASGLIEPWAKFRDISYIFFIIIFVAIGFAIMLRARIDPRTVMTIQNQIPKLIIGLVMITLSFAIAGFAVDLMWVATYGVINVIGNIDSKIRPDIFTSELNNNAIGFANNTLVAQNNSALHSIPAFCENVGDSGPCKDNSAAGLFGLATDAGGSIQKVVSKAFSSQTTNGTADDKNKCDNPICGITNIVGSALGTVWNVVTLPVTLMKDILTLNLSDLLNDTLGSLVGALATTLMSFVVGLLAFFVIIILVFVALFKLWIALLKCYISIMIDVIFAPFWIMAGMLPGAKGAGFGGWIKDLAANLAVFPAIIALFLLADYFILHFSASASTLFVPPLIGPTDGISGLAPIVGFAFIYASPHVVDAVKKAVKNMGGLDLSAAGKSFDALQTAGVGMAGAMWGRAYYKNPRTGMHEGVAAEGMRNLPGGIKKAGGYLATKPGFKQVATGAKAVGGATSSLKQAVGKTRVGGAVGRVAGGVGNVARGIKSGITVSPEEKYRREHGVLPPKEEVQTQDNPKQEPKTDQTNNSGSGI
jgi:hypothetical protein